MYYASLPVLGRINHRVFATTGFGVIFAATLSIPHRGLNWLNRTVMTHLFLITCIHLALLNPVPIHILWQESLAWNSEGFVGFFLVGAHFLLRYTLGRDLSVLPPFVMPRSHLRNDSHSPFDEPRFHNEVVRRSYYLLRHKLVQGVSTQSGLEEFPVRIIQGTFLGA